MKHTIIAVILLITATLLVPIAARATASYVIPDHERILVMESGQNFVYDPQTNGREIVWHDSNENVLSLYDTQGGDLYYTPLNFTETHYLHEDRMVYWDMNRPNGFYFIDGQGATAEFIELEEEILPPRCFNGEWTAYNTSQGLFTLYRIADATRVIVETGYENSVHDCSMSDDYVAFSELPDEGLAGVYFADLSDPEGITAEIAGVWDGWPPEIVMLGNLIYTNEAPDIRAYDVKTGAWRVVTSGASLYSGYESANGHHYLLYYKHTSPEDPSARAYLYMPQADAEYRLGHASREHAFPVMGGGLIVWTERMNGSDGLYMTRFSELDSDHDGLTDENELLSHGSNPQNSDTDGDGYIDGTEVSNGYSPVIPAGSGQATLADRLSGRILIQAERHGEAWYVNPQDRKRYYLADGDAAYSIMRQLGLGITNADLARISVQGSTQPGDPGLLRRVNGRILLQVEEHGEAWYVDPLTGKRSYLENGNAAYGLVRSHGLGITNADLNKIPVGNL